LIDLRDCFAPVFLKAHVTFAGTIVAPVFVATANLLLVCIGTMLENGALKEM
jgi:hypothetical protein